MAKTGQATFLAGVDQFNRGQFFEAHETWEALWLAAPGSDKLFLQGAIQLAAAFHHCSRGNRRGAQTLLDAGLAKLRQFPAAYRGIRVGRFRKQSTAFLRALQNAESPDGLALPRIERTARPGVRPSVR